jgi:PKD repeat protein
MTLQRVIGLIEEETYATEPTAAAPDFHMEITDLAIPIDGEPLKIESGLSRDIRTVRQGRYVPMPEWGGNLDLKTIGHHLKGLLGDYEYTAGTGGAMNKHEFWSGGNMLLPSFTMYGSMDLFVKKVVGVLIDSFSLEVSNELIKTSVKTIASKDSKTDGVPEATALKLIETAIPLAYYDVALEFGGEVPPGIVTSLKWDAANNIKVDDAQGIGSRYILRKPPATKFENKLDMEVSLEPETLKYIEMFEYGEAGADSPQDCKFTTVPLKIVLSACERPDEKLTISFPDCLCKVEYSASGTDAIKLKLTMEALSTTTTTLADGTTKVLSAVVCTLENNMPEIVAGGVDMLIEPVAAFSATPLSGAAPLQVTFTNTSTGEGNTYAWTFGDTGTSTAKNPTHTYQEAGTYEVALVATNSEGTDTETKTAYITVS